MLKYKKYKRRTKVEKNGALRFPCIPGADLFVFCIPFISGICLLCFCFASPSPPSSPIFVCYFCVLHPLHIWYLFVVFLFCIPFVPFISDICLLFLCFAPPSSPSSPRLQKPPAMHFYAIPAFTRSTKISQYKKLWI